MIFRPFNPATLTELAAIQAEIDRIAVEPTGSFGLEYPAGISAADYDPFTTSETPLELKSKSDRLDRLENDRQAIHQADYDLSQQHRG